jgi:hypothetical protein
MAIKLELTIDDENNSYSIPTNWDDVTVGQFCELFSFNREGKNELEISIQIISIFTKIPEDDIYMLSPEQFSEISKLIDFTSKEIDTELTDYVEIDNNKYYVKKDFSSLTMGEIISIETIMSQGENGLLSVMDKLLCIFLRKKKDNGNLEAFKNNFMERADTFKNIPISGVYKIFGFFSDGEISLVDNTKESSKNQKV